MPMDEADQTRSKKIGEGALETPESDQVAERRAYPRHKYRVDVVWMFGLDPTGGVTLDVSRGGVLVRLAAPVSDTAEGHTCGVRFLNAGAELKPHYVVGTVRRLEATEEGCLVGIEFNAPLEVLGLP